MIKFLEVRIGDPNIIRLVNKFLKAGLMDNGVLMTTEIGTPQGSIVSPTLANIYLHYSLDLWFEKVIKRNFRGQAEITRYADDFLGFTHYCAKSKRGYFRVKRKTSKKKFRAKVKDFNQWIKSVRNKLRIGDIFKLTKQKLMGHYQYYGITDNSYIKTHQRIKISDNGELFTPTYKVIIEKYKDYFIEQIYIDEEYGKFYLVLRVNDKQQ